MAHNDLKKKYRIIAQDFFRSFKNGRGWAPSLYETGAGIVHVNVKYVDWQFAEHKIGAHDVNMGEMGAEAGIDPSSKALCRK